MPTEATLYDRGNLLCKIDEVVRGPREPIRSRTGALIGMKTHLTVRMPVAPEVNSTQRYELCEGGSRRSPIVFFETKPDEANARFLCSGFLEH